jgi:hypothetical protein
MNPTRLLAAAVFASFAGPTPVQAQQVDMDAMMKWGAADLVRYHIVGVYQGQPHIASDGSGRADVSDRVVIDLTWQMSESKPVGKPSFQNTRSTVTNPRDREAACLAPVLKGDYEHYELLGVEAGLGGVLALKVQTTYPVVEVAQSCTASRKAVPAKTVTRQDDFGIVSPVTFAMPIPDSDDLRISKDKKSFIVKKAGWTWTLTPTLAGK